MPVIKKEDKEHLEVVIFGANSMGRAVARTLGHVAHYPNSQNINHRSRITIVSENVEEWAREFMASHRGLFCLSNWMLTDANGVTELHSPVGEYGDYLDIEWHFVYGTSTSIELESLFCENSVKRIVVCEDSDTQSIHTTLHLSPAFKDVKVAVYQKGCADILQWAESTHLYHDICIGDQVQVCRMLGS